MRRATCCWEWREAAPARLRRAARRLPAMRSRRRSNDRIMKTNRVPASVGVYATLLLAPVLFAQGGRGPGGRGGILAHDPANDTKPYDKHDLSGIWSRNGSPGGYGGGGTCRDCGDRGYGNDVPPFTPLGQKKFEANKPSI